METYKETVYRFRIVRHEELPPEHKASYRLNGIDPDTLWSLVWSFKTMEDAKEELANCNMFATSYQTYKIVDGGATEEVERMAWF